MSEILALLLELSLTVSIAVFLGIFLLQTLLVTFPTYVLMFYGGMRFGIWWGAVFNLLGMILTTSFGYILGRLGKMENVMEHPSLQKFKIQVDEKGIAAIGFLRVLPILPYNVTSIGSGMLKINWKRYFIVNNLALVPYTVIWAILGDYFGEVLASYITIELSWNLLIPTGVFFVGVVLLIRWLRNKYGQEELEEDD